MNASTLHGHHTPDWGRRLLAELALFAVLATPAGLRAQTGNVDTIFVTTNANTVVYSAAVQADGKIILGGSFTTVAGVARNRMRDSTQTGPLTPPSTPMPPTP